MLYSSIHTLITTLVVRSVKRISLLLRSVRPEEVVKLITTILPSKEVIQRTVILSSTMLKTVYLDYQLTYLLVLSVRLDLPTTLVTPLKLLKKEKLNTNLLTISVSLMDVNRVLLLNTETMPLIAPKISATVINVSMVTPE